MQGPLRIARYSLVSWQQWARFPVLRLEGPPLGRLDSPLNKSNQSLSGRVRRHEDSNTNVSVVSNYVFELEIGDMVKKERCR